MTMTQEHLSEQGPPSVQVKEPTQQLWVVAVFAYNEESHITQCLSSVMKASAEHPIHVYVLANGCSDRTEAIVREFSRDHPWSTLFSIEVGDKANAWNVFVHDVAPRCQVGFFLDGDITVEPGAFDALFTALEAAPEANAAAAVPCVGRSQTYLRQLVCEHRLVLGNLYALRGEFLWRAKQLGARLPVGYIGEDGLVTSLAKWDLEPRGQFVHERVAPCPEAGFSYRSFSPWNLRDWRTYVRRRIRYSLRHFQHELLVPLITSRGLRGMPNSVSELYKQQAQMIPHCRPRRGIDTIFDSITLYSLRRKV